MSKSKFAKKVQKDFLRTAHRGACVYEPENTLEAFQSAVDIGVDMIETDVRLTADEVPILAHDSHLIRLSEITDRFPDRESYLIRDFRFNELQQLQEIGVRHIQELRRGKEATRECFHHITPEEQKTYLNPDKISRILRHTYRIPSLVESLDWLQNTPSVILNLELKTYPESHPKLVFAVMDILEKMPQERLLISSFDHYALLEIKKRFPSLSTAQLNHDRVVGAAKYGAEVLQVDAIHSHIGFLEEEELIRREISECHQYELGVHVWTVDKPKSMKLLLQNGVDGIITNFPNRLNHVLAELRALTCA